MPLLLAAIKFMWLPYRNLGALFAAFNYRRNSYLVLNTTMNCSFHCFWGNGSDALGREDEKFRRLPAMDGNIKAEA